jgi:hypothetical protein
MSVCKFSTVLMRQYVSLAVCEDEAPMCISVRQLKLYLIYIVKNRRNWLILKCLT